MKKTMRIRVTQDHIDAARFMEEDCFTNMPLDDRCPIALALKTSGFPDARVGTRLYQITSAPGIELPNQLRQFIENFDSGRPVAPFTFTLVFADHEF